MPPPNRNRHIIRNLGFFLGILTLISFTTIDPKEKNIKETTTTLVTVKNNTATVSAPYLQKDFIGFKEALAFKESRGIYNLINKHGYVGKYQFGMTTLRNFKIYSKQQFLKNPELQEKTFIALCKVNKWILRKEIQRFTGKKINGIEITESGILAAAHLGGAGSVKRYLRSYGRKGFKDAFGTSVSYYMKRFGGYNVSNIIAERKPKVS